MSMRLSIAVAAAAPADIPYRTHQVRGGDGVAQGAFSSMTPTDESYSKAGTTITCYGG